MAAAVPKITFAGRFLPICGRFLIRHGKPKPQGRSIQFRQQLSTSSRALLSREGRIGLSILCTSAVMGFSALELYKKMMPELPKVDAAEPEISQRRKTMNFVADVVESASPAVVYLEIRGR